MLLKVQAQSHHTGGLRHGSTTYYLATMGKLLTLLRLLIYEVEVVTVLVLWPLDNLIRHTGAKEGFLFSKYGILQKRLP